jgi:hypothetical protein
MPDLYPAGLLTDRVVLSFIRQICAASKPWLAGRADGANNIGIGAFNLVRREAFLAGGGCEYLRLVIADDMGVGLVMKRAGGKSGVAILEGLAGLTWYRNLAEAANGAEKGFASVADFSLARAAFLAAALLALELSPVAAAAAMLAGPIWAIYPAGLALGAWLLAMCQTAIFARGRWAAIFLGPLAAIITATVMVRVGLAGRRLGGARWRGTVYAPQLLRHARRVRPTFKVEASQQPGH